MRSVGAPHDVELLGPVQIELRQYPVCTQQTRLTVQVPGTNSVATPVFFSIPSLHTVSRQLVPGVPIRLSAIPSTRPQRKSFGGFSDVLAAKLITNCYLMTLPRYRSVVYKAKLL